MGARTSSWTYHIALSMLKTTEIIGLDCRFESHARPDGLVETPEEPRRSVIVAEWEGTVEYHSEKDKAACRSVGMPPLRSVNDEKT
jgi:hypothetical protein